MTLPLRSLVFWLHLAAGLTAGAVVLVMSATGVLLAYERQIVERADEEVRRVTPPAAARPLSFEELIRRARVARPDAAPTGATIAADPREAAALALGREGVLYVDPYTGVPTGEGSRRVRSFFRATTDLHRWLAAEGDRRDLARGVTGAANLAFLFLVASGLYLWVPRSFTRRQVRNVAWFRRGLAGKARDFNWHNTIGLWIALPLLVIVASGVVMSYGWANDLVYRLTGSDLPDRPPSRQGSGGGPGRGGAERASVFEPASVAGLDPLWRTARERVPGWKTIALRPPREEGDPMAFTIARSHRGRPDLRDTLELDRATGAVVRWQPFSEQSAGRRARIWLRFLHTGEAGGFLGQTVAGAASAGSLVMVWTGFALAWRRFFPRRAASVSELPRGLESAASSIEEIGS